MNDLFKHFLRVRNMDYLVINPHLRILEFSEGVLRFSEGSEGLKMGEDIQDYFPELIGTEEIIDAIIQGNHDYFELNSMSRQIDETALTYFNIYFLGISREGEPVPELILLFEDVTKRMELEQALVQETNESRLLLNAYSHSQQYIDRIITSMEDILIVTNQQGIIKKVNLATLSLLGYSQADLINAPISSFVEDDSFLQEYLTESYLKKEDFLFKNLELTCKKKQADKVILEFSISTLTTDTDDALDFIYVGRDVTARKRAQQRMLTQYQISRILSEAPNIHEGLLQILRSTCESLGWVLGEVWMLENFLEEPLLLGGEPSQNSASEIHSIEPKLRCIELWVNPALNQPEIQDFYQQIKLGFNVGLPGLVWSSGFAHWIDDVMVNDHCIQKYIAQKLGLHAAFGFPIKDGKEVLGVMTFLSQEICSPDPELMQTMTAIGSQLGQFIQRQLTEIALHHQQQQTERLLLNILPEPIANRLKKETKTIAEHFAEVTVLFADIVGFTQISSSLSPIDLVNLLNELFSAFDRLTEKYGLEKIKTIGDAYMVVGGLPYHRSDHAIAIAEMALDMQNAIIEFNQIHHKAFSLRIGIHSGPVVAGVIGIKKFLYDLWGDTVNIASRMESHGLAGRIQMSEDTYYLLPDQYIVAKRGTISIKGKGGMNTYFLLARKGEDYTSILEKILPLKNQRTNGATQHLVEVLHNKLRENSPLESSEFSEFEDSSPDLG
ncbi:PAS fold family [Planktothrix serta PCC 8927]|uniref:Adenylate cyclase n=1 Tax=Planktothrix serta PCC 8927 TaxID=671068 RepID=A0A7Z9BTG5_9CYAN|nr:adenylate/guanylate cyclase domain-containing protein [Planktothrix serta]VXD20764.1 PAS fold family [Planktothrix serta PCC 8927]